MFAGQFLGGFFVSGGFVGGEFVELGAEFGEFLSGAFGGGLGLCDAGFGLFAFRFQFGAPGLFEGQFLGGFFVSVGFVGGEVFEIGAQFGEFLRRAFGGGLGLCDAGFGFFTFRL